MTEATCLNQAAYRYTWPGRDESFICDEHVGKLRAVTSAMSLHLQVIPLTGPDGARPGCCQKIKS